MPRLWASLVVCKEWASYPLTQLPSVAGNPARGDIMNSPYVEGITAALELKASHTELLEALRDLIIACNMSPGQELTVSLAIENANAAIAKSEIR